MINIAIFASGSGTNAENIARLFNSGSRLKVALVITNKEHAGVVERMEKLKVPVMYIPNSVWDGAPDDVVEVLHRYDISLVVLAGFMHYVPAAIIKAYEGRILNIHPSLLPKYGGKGMYGRHVHKAVIAAGEKESGVTVHYVTEEMDAGEILMQQSVEITPEDTPESLEAKIHPIEYNLYPRAIMEAVKRMNGAEKPQTAEEPATEPQPQPESEAEPKQVPPPMPSVEQDWADALQIKLPQPPPPAPSAPAPLPSPATPAPTPTTVTVGPAPTQIAQPLSQPSQRPDMPKSYLVWSLVMMLICCLPTGIVALIYSVLVSSRYRNEDYAGAERASYRAQIWIIISFILGIIWNVVHIPMMLAV